jgi:hypothetical protein
MTRFSLYTLAALVTLTTIAGCKKKDAVVDTTGGTVAVPTPDMPAMLMVMDIDMGRKLGPDMKITDKTDDFMPKDTIFASVHTSGAATNSAVVARWMYNDSTLVTETTQNVSPTGDAYTAFHIEKAAGLAKGKYTVHIMIDGKEARTKDVTVK